MEQSFRFLSTSHLHRPNLSFHPRWTLGFEQTCRPSLGGMNSMEPAEAMDFQEDYLQIVMGFVGISDVHFVRVAVLNVGQDKCEIGVKVVQVITELAT
jgi:hypothetical protein